MKSQFENLSSAVFALAKIIANDKSAFNESDYNTGSQFVGIYENANFPENFRNIRALKVEVILSAINDLSTGAEQLKNEHFGVCFFKNKLTRLEWHQSEPPEGEILYSIFLKDSEAVRKWRLNENEDLSQDDLNLSIYFLVVALAQFEEIFI